MAGAQERTEKPTPKKQSDARKRGQIARSKELSAVGILMAGGFALLFSGGLIRSHFHQLLENLWGEGFQIATGSGLDGSLFLTALYHVSIMLAPVLLAVVTAGVGVNLLQTKGVVFSFEALQISLGNLSPLRGIKRLISLRSLTELIKSLLKLIVIGGAVGSLLHSEQDLLLSLADRDVMGVLEVTGSLAFQILIRVGGIMLIVSLLDVIYQRWQHDKDLMMTKQEVKEEHRQTEGNPEIKSRIRSIQRALAKQRMLANVPKATLVITNPTHYAVALVYSPGMEAPKVVAKGADFLARKVIKIARKNGVPVIQNPPLARALYKQVKLEGTIPVTLYRAVAKVLAYVFQQQRSAK